MRRYLEAGKVVTTHGLRGEIKIYPWCDSAAVFCELKALYRDSDGGGAIGLEGARAQGNMAVVKLCGVDTLEAARQWIDKILFLDREELVLPADSCFIADLIGLRAVDADDQTLEYGAVCDYTHNGAHGLYHIRLKNGGTGLLPDVGAMVASIDLAAGRLYVRPVKGLFNDEN